MSVSIAYHCFNAGIGVAKLVLEYKKIQEMSLLRSEIQYHNQTKGVIRQYIALLKSDIQDLMHIFFRSACQNLDLALYADEKCYQDYLLQARNRFIDALAIEKNENLILSYLGLSLCQLLLGDINNYKRSLRQILEISFTKSQIDEEFICEFIQGTGGWFAWVKVIPYIFMGKSSLIKTSYENAINECLSLEEMHNANISNLNQHKKEIMDDIVVHCKEITDERMERYNKYIAEIDAKIKVEMNELIEVTRHEREVRITGRMLKKIFEYGPVASSERYLLQAFQYAISSILYEDFRNFHQEISDLIIETFPNLLNSQQ